MDYRIVVALVVGAFLVGPVGYVVKVTTDAFRMSPMERIVGHYHRAAALWIISFAVVYLQVVGYFWMEHENMPGFAPAWWLLTGILPFAWWFISRQAHAQFDPETFVPAATVGWTLQRAVHQYLKAHPDQEVRVRTYQHTVVITWCTTTYAAFNFESRGKASRLWARLYALNPDTNQFNTLTFTQNSDDDQARATLSSDK